MKSNVTLYLNRDKTRVVPEGDPSAAFLLVRAGKEISEAEITRINPAAPLAGQASKFSSGRTAEPEAKAIEAPAEDKAIEAPAENKSSGPRRSRSQE